MDRSASVASVELVLDAETEQGVRADWARLAEAGLSSAGAHDRPSNRPHVSLTVRSAIGEPDALGSVAGTLPMRIDFSGLILFRHDDRVVLARAVVPSAELLGVQQRIHELTADWGEAMPHSEPGSWTPHVTLARRLRIADLSRALERVGADPRGATAIALRTWDAATRTVTDL